MSVGLQKLDFMVNLIDRVSAPAGKMMKTMDRVTTNIQGGIRKIGYGTAGLVGVGFAINRLIAPAVEFESVMADVNKTVNFDSPEGLKEFGRDILEMTKTLPLTAKGLGEIAAAGGRLGLDKTKLPDFVNVTAKMATAFDLQTDIAGEYAANLANIYKIPINELGLLGDVINHLSDNTAAKAGDIINVMQRVGGTGQQFGLATNQIAAMSAAMLALGIPAEKTATSMDSLFIKLLNIDKAAPKVQKVLKGMGLSGETLAANIQKNPQAALSDFLQKINGLSGKDGLNALTAIFGINHAPKLALLAGGYDKYAKTLGLVANKQNFVGSMEKEFQIRAKTTANMLVLMGNSWDRLMINMGNLILPRVVDVIGGFNAVLNPVSSAISSFSEKFPVLSTVLGWVATSLVGIIATVALLSIGMGLASMLSGGFTLAMLVLNGAMAVAKLSIFSVIPAIWGFTAALLANPMTWVVLGVVALGAALVGLVVYWDDITAAIGRFFNKISSLAGIKDLLMGIIPDFILDLMGVDKTAASTAVNTPTITPPPSINAGGAAQASPAANGGVINRITQANSTSNRSNNITINNPPQAMNGQTLSDELAFFGG